jgi:hypothetical protein
MPDEPASTAPSASSSFAEPSNAAVMSLLTQMNDRLLSVDNRLIFMDDQLLTMDQRMQLIETDVAQIKTNVWTLSATSFQKISGIKFRDICF